MELRGFDSYEITLGDEMRGERASMGKSLAQVEADLRVKAKLITAIENSDLSGFPNQSVIAGYVRSYARYLGMDAEDCYRRFCQESGYESPSALQSTTGKIHGGKGLSTGAVISAVGAEISKSRFAAPPTTNRFQARISLGALTSSAALIGLVAGLAYGGYALLQDIQRVGIAPIPSAPSVVADAPNIAIPAIDMQALQKPQAGDYRGGGALAAVVAPTDLPPLEQLRRDGPISAINPETAGMFARLQELEPPVIDTPDDGIMLAAFNTEPLAVERIEPITEAPKGVSLVFLEEAWIRVRESGNTTVFEGTFKPGETLALPDRLETPRLKAGNAGGIFVYVDGIAYGPLGERGHVARNISLLASDIRETVPIAAGPLPSLDVVPTENAEVQRRAEANIQQ